MKEIQCSNCGKDANVVRGSYCFIESGLSWVTLQGIELIQCEHCGNEDPIIPRINDLMKTLVVATIAKPYRLTGEEVRFLRKYLRKTAAEMAQLLHVDKTTVSKWENEDDPIGEQSDRLLRVIAVALGDGLKEKIEEVIAMFPQIDSRPQKIGIEINPQDMSHQYT
jgi:DNA-binding transcriptional regulator YiaG